MVWRPCLDIPLSRKTSMYCRTRSGKLWDQGYQKAKESSFPWSADGNDWLQAPSLFLLLIKLPVEFDNVVRRASLCMSQVGVFCGKVLLSLSVDVLIGPSRNGSAHSAMVSRLGVVKFHSAMICFFATKMDMF